MLDPLTHYLNASAGRHGPLALMYHSVQKCKRTPEWPWAISLERFEDHLDFLNEHGWVTCTIDDLANARFRHHQRTIAITFDDGFADNLLALDALQKRKMRATWFIVTGSIGRTAYWPDTGRPGGRMLESDELRALDRAGMEVGSHTCNHRRLPSLEFTDVSRELSESRDILENLLTKPVTSFAYPYGDWDARCEQAVQAAGYKAACTTMTGTALRDRHPLRIRRLTISNRDGLGPFARKLGGASNQGGLDSAVRYLAQRVGARLGFMG